MFSRQAIKIMDFRCVLVCQNRTCRKQGGEKVLAAFEAHSVVGVKVVGSGCLGQCGMGPMVRVIPDEVWYCRVRPDEVSALVERHLKGGKAIAAMLYRKFHP
jgi:(2Fe-2S) ferredoxin